jgi:hypothetical protein
VAATAAFGGRGTLEGASGGVAGGGAR